MLHCFINLSYLAVEYSSHSMCNIGQSKTDLLKYLDIVEYFPAYNFPNIKMYCLFGACIILEEIDGRPSVNKTLSPAHFDTMHSNRRMP